MLPRQAIPGVREIIPDDFTSIPSSSRTRGNETAIETAPPHGLINARLSFGPIGPIDAYLQSAVNSI